jgi:glycosyltransferase involved in cell wall biosynthesis
MRVWLINPNEQVPSDGENVRLARMGLIAEELVRRGHDVLWWHSTFHHTSRTQRAARNAEVTICPNYRVRFLRSPGYRNSLSIGRLRHNRQLGREFFRQVAGLKRPELILSSLPVVELSYEAVRYGKSNGVPVVVDLRDMWPDMFLFHIPPWARGMGRLALAPLFRKARYACAHASALTGHTAEFVRWGLRVAGRTQTARDRDFPHGYPRPVMTDVQRARAAEFWRQFGLTDDSNAAVICFFGTIGHVLDLEPVVAAARAIGPERNVRFVFCGTGSKLDSLRRLAAEVPNVVLPGWVGVPEIQWLLQRSMAGLAPWKATPDYEATISNKVIEYWSAGVPVLTSLSRGALVDLIGRHDCGMSYGNGAGQLRRAIAQLLDRPEQRRQMSQNAARLFAERFDAAKVYGEMVGHLELIAAEKKYPLSQQAA